MNPDHFCLYRNRLVIIFSNTSIMADIDNNGSINERKPMKTLLLTLLSGALLNVPLLSFARNAHAQSSGDTHPVIVMKTSKGTIEITLDAEKAPVTVKNFLSYVNEAFYDSTIFHRVIRDFMIQGGGFTATMLQLPTKEPIRNEAANGLLNKRGTIVMARRNTPNSATCQFFINHKDNDFLDHKDNTPRGYGYAVFGRVTSGMDVVDSIAAVKTGAVGGFRDVPLEPVVIESVRVKK